MKDKIGEALETLCKECCGSIDKYGVNIALEKITALISKDYILKSDVEKAIDECKKYYDKTGKIIKSNIITSEGEKEYEEEIKTISTEQLRDKINEVGK